ncbi:hypothetical protein HKX48_004401 [Thoreauomyces humboldtii]|nr:hypothetical protein HKX48_004401 [Thoreauomyces humboldtii]
MSTAFVTRSGRTLVDPTSSAPLRFVSFNCPTLTLNDDPSMMIPTVFEQEDLLQSIVDLGGRVTRTYVLGVQESGEDATAIKHIVKSNGNIMLKEDVMVGMDNAVAAANRMGVKLIIPLIDNWEWWGGYASFTGLVDQSLSSSAFFSDATVMTAWKTILTQVLTRNNTVNGIPYRNETAILAWETGNELELNNARIPAAWTADIAAHIKSVDTNHLVVDGSFKYGWDATTLADPNVDIYSNHYYRNLVFSGGEWAGMVILAVIALVAVVLAIMTFCFPRRVRWVKVPPYTRSPSTEARIRQFLTLAGCVILVGAAGGGIAAIIIHRMPNPRYGALSKADANIAAGADKVFIAGEFGLASTSSISDVLANVVSNVDGFAGAMVWSLRGHSRNGGFYTHSEDQGYYAYHYPGFSTSSSGFGSDEQSVVNAVASYAKTLATRTGFTIQAITTPSAPTLLASTTPQLKWLGVTGCTSYDIARTDAPVSATSSWTYVAQGIVDSVNQNTTLWTDSNVVKGSQYGYSVRCHTNGAGTGPLSNVITVTA